MMQKTQDLKFMIFNMGFILGLISGFVIGVVTMLIVTNTKEEN